MHSLNTLALAQANSTLAIALVLLFGCFIFFGILFYFVPIKLWLAARVAHAPVSILSLIGMRLKRIVPSEIVNPMIAAVQARVPVTRTDLEAHYLAGGNVHLVVRALISADKARIPLNFQKAAAIDLAGRNVFEAVRMSVEPRVIDVPDSAKGRQTIDAVAQDGIQLKVKARVTVKADIEKLVGGATEETIIARVGEGIVTTIGSAGSHKAVLQDPDQISKKVLEKGLDAGTAFSILSIDIADIDVGENIGARLQIDQAEADKQIAQAKAEERRALAVAAEQEMKAREQEMRAKVVEAEAEVPLAMAEAFRGGRLGVMDYYRMRNIEADTNMRDSLASQPDSSGQ
ncbi:MAG: SigmaW regulon antibacterial [candidate division BRC1 bacterium ADurb.BinA364]|nr:MAG: SigmaW regulon antibacterial [candidate division BRC1 bacterium ADurb.BinA364]